MSFNAIDVTTDEQFVEIMRVHSIVSEERSVPRFFCYIVEPNTWSNIPDKLVVGYPNCNEQRHDFGQSEIIKSIFGAEGYAAEEAVSLDEEELGQDCVEVKLD